MENENKSAIQKMTSGELYCCVDEEMTRKQTECLELLYDYNATRPGESKKREELLGKMRAVIEAEPLAKIDYVSMVDALTMQPVEKADRSVLVAMAVYIGKTRLIDNFSYEV